MHKKKSRKTQDRHKKKCNEISPLPAQKTNTQGMDKAEDLKTSVKGQGGRGKRKYDEILPLQAQTTNTQEINMGEELKTGGKDQGGRDKDKISPNKINSGVKGLKKTKAERDADLTGPNTHIDLNTGSTISSFTLRIERKLPVVDKTGYLAELLTQRTQSAVFVIGPRRFGKSFGAQTVKAIFDNSKEWWNLYCQEFSIVKDYKYDFISRPVLDLDFSAVTTVTELTNKVARELLFLIKANGLAGKLDRQILEYTQEKSVTAFLQLFSYVIEELAAKHQRGVVIVVDEYDYPLVSRAEKEIQKRNSLNSEELDLDKQVEDLREVMRLIFEIVKELRKKTFATSYSPHEPFVYFFYLTGIAPLNGTSLFSALNDIYDVRNDENLLEIIGYTNKDIEHVFKQHIHQKALQQLRQRLCVSEDEDEALGEIKDDILKNIRRNYNGFRFVLNQKNALYSPYAINMFFDTWHSQGPIKYEPFFARSGSSRLVWMTVERMSLEAKMKFFEALADEENENEITIYSCNKDNLTLNQTLDKLFGKPARLGFFTGLFTVQTKGSSKDFWNLKMTNNEMRKHLHSYIDDSLELSEGASQMLKTLANGDYKSFFEIVNNKLKAMSAFSNPSQEKAKSDIEFECYGHTLFVLVLQRLQDWMEKSSSDIIKNLRFMSNKAVDTSQKRLDCWICFDTTKGPKALALEFKCKMESKVALEEAFCDLNKKYSNAKANTKKAYNFLKFSQTTYIAGAIGFGTIQALDFYEVKQQKNKEVLTKIMNWEP